MNAGGVALAEHAPSEGPLLPILRKESAAATQKGLTPYAYLSATWCGPCQTLKHSLGDARMVEAFKGTYLIKLDVDAWEKELQGAGLDASAIPVFIELDANGRPTGRRIDGSAWDKDTVENMAPALSTFFHQKHASN